MYEDGDKDSNLDFLNFIPQGDTAEENDDVGSAIPSAGATQVYYDKVDTSYSEAIQTYDEGEIALMDASLCVSRGQGVDDYTHYSKYLRPGIQVSFCGTPVVQNIVASVHLGNEIDLREIAISTRNAEYNPRKFNALILRMQNPRCTGLVFRTGRLIVTGCKTVESARLGAKRIAKMVRRELGGGIQFNDFKIENIIATFNCNVPIRLERLYEEHKLFCNYEPEIFAGLVYRIAIPCKSEAVLLVFVSGNVIVTGCRSPEDIYLIYRRMAPILCEFKH
ncbi:TATA-box-binding protein domain protein [Babesia bovis T2Bo]|uniref:TATA-box binding protein n=1 Tax=Babesia bovis TaxID=5865 RepID=A7AVR8_BABBO|nr:TATA-box-binding protein domain protein [Babesia bovis T2Bo]EDO05894.1 TATA-box-binding protein domain protein [Babesia bovis T2Bo]|eukprot:XP_001609462.1 TATA-box binding protein [Babesia bovis T2Bo]